MSDDKKSTLLIIILPALIIIGMIIGIIFWVVNPEEGNYVPEPPIDEERFDVIHTEQLSLGKNLGKKIISPVYTCVIADRETDVEYLIIYNGDGIGVTTMRDKGGTVLLRE